jgi:hypothetical protein
MSDADGPYIARRFYESLFAIGTIDIDTIPYALDDAVSALRASGASPERWATFIHMGAWIPDDEVDKHTHALYHFTLLTFAQWLPLAELTFEPESDQW